MANRTNVLHGAVVLFKFNAKTIALSQNMEITERTPLQPVDPVGTTHSAEHIRVAYEVDVSLSIYRESNASLKAVGLFPQTSRPLDILEHEGVTFEIYDLINDLTAERVTDLKIEEVSRGYTKGQLTMYNCRGKAIMAGDESET